MTKFMVPVSMVQYFSYKASNNAATQSHNPILLASYKLRAHLYYHANYAYAHYVIISGRPRLF